MNKKISRILAGFLCALMFCTPVFANDTDALKAELETSFKKMKEINSQIDTTKKTIAEIEKEISKSNKAIASIDAEVANLDAKIKDLDNRMAERKAKIVELQQLQDKQQKELEERLRVMYMYGNDGYLQALFSSESVTDFIARADMMKNVMKADKDAVTALQNTKQELIDQNAALEADKVLVEQAKVAQLEARRQQEGMKGQQAQYLSENQGVVDKLKADIASEEAAAKDIIAILGPEAPSGFIQTGEYYWPISPDNPQAFWVSSPFAGRIHPITGEWSNHQGVDIAASYGTPLMAAGDGVVSIAGSNGGYGECVVINMGTDSAGNKIATLYGHMSSIATSVGATVKKGDVIGYVGSTGNSTGPHLHFGWYLNDNFVDALEYYPGQNWKYVD